MPSFFSRKKDKVSKSKKTALYEGDTPNEPNPAPQRWEDAWTRKSVEPEEVQELIRTCTIELKSRGLDIPFLLLPFRPTSDISAAKSFVRTFSNSPYDRGQPLRGHALQQELRLVDPMVICSVLKWCWSRLPGGIVTWEVYELFRQGEQDSGMARDAFTTMLPIIVESDARNKIIFDFCDLLSAIAAHGKTNGLGGRKLSRLAGWWAFEHEDTGNGFDGGYKNWTLAADAMSHMFFGYLRSLCPESINNGISTLPNSLLKLVRDTEYPPERPSLLQSYTTKVVMIVDSVSPTPIALLRRSNHFEYRDEDRALQEFSAYDDPNKALTDECRRVLSAISSTNSSHASRASRSTGMREATWSRFEDMGFSDTMNETQDDQYADGFAKRRSPQGLRTSPQSKTMNMGRPTTPSWADFLNVGFTDEKINGPKPLLLPPDKILPPIDISNRGKSSQSHRPRLESDQNLEPGELASITKFDLDDVFWWVWISSLAGEEPPERKASFGRCAVVETVIRSGKWLVMEEMVKGAAPEPEVGAYIAPKKSIFSWTKRNKGLTRSKSTGKQPTQQTPQSTLKSPQSHATSKVSIGPDQHARVQATAAELRRKQQLELLKQKEALASRGRRGREMDAMSNKTNSVLTLQPLIVKEASPAMKWANGYDKDQIRAAYLSNNTAGRGLGQATMYRHEENDHSGYSSNRNSYAEAANPDVRREQQLPTPPESDAAPEVPTKVKSNLPSPAPFPPTPGLENGHDPRMSEQAAEVALPGSLNSPDPRSPAAQSMRQAQPIQQSFPEQERVDSPDPRDMRSPTPDQQKGHKLKKDKKDKKEPTGFRKLFSRKKKNPGRSETPANDAPESSLQPGGATKGRRFSGFGPNGASQSAIVSADQDRSNNYTPEGHRAEEGEATPIQSPHSYEQSTHESLSRVDTDDAHEANREFSNFDQGPLDDVPAFVPDDSPRTSLDNEEVMGEQLTKAPSPVQDRWAQIRKNAAQKAAESEAARQSEEQSRGGQSTMTGDDGETSGEETIEARVARIKARVAELTSNVSPPPPTSPKVRN